MFNWLKKQRDITRKTAGLAEKEKSTQRKIDVASKILDRRESNREVETDRRVENNMLNSKFAHPR